MALWILEETAKVDVARPFGRHRQTLGQRARAVKQRPPSRHFGPRGPAYGLTEVTAPGLPGPTGGC